MRRSLTRREALLSLAGMLAGSPFLRAQLDPRAWYQGATATGTPMILASPSSIPIQKVAAQPSRASVGTHQQPIERADCRPRCTGHDAAVVQRLRGRRRTRADRPGDCGWLSGRVHRASGDASRAAIPWKTIASVVKGLDAPVVIKGVMSPEDATIAFTEGARGVIVSDHGAAAGRPSPIERVSAIADAVAHKGAVLVDGAFGRGSDIAKALALGAPNLQALTRSMVRIDRR